jgi:hypothetical protein
MDDAEIDKVISEFEAVGDQKYGWDALFRDPKTRRFWELVYPPSGAPRALKSITAHDARMRYSAAFSSRKFEVRDYWLDGATLQSVTFVADYWQLHFDLSTISAFTRTEVNSGDAIVRDGDDQFRNRLCEQIGKVVESFDLQEAIACTIKFDDLSSISISLRPADYQGPEAINISGAGHFVVV